MDKEILEQLKIQNKLLEQIANKPQPLTWYEKLVKELKKPIPKY